MIFDTHCHLNSDQLFSNYKQYIIDAQKENVGNFLVVGFDKKTSLLAVKIAELQGNCYSAIGIHPTEIYDLKDGELEEILSLSKTKKNVAIGEIGLDYHWVKDPLQQELQKEYFIKQIEFANNCGLPIVVHNRDALADCLDILKEHTPKYGGIMHCYSGSVEAMHEFIKLGMYISLGGPVTFLNAKTPKEVAKAVPLDRLLVETDCPYLAPHPHRGKMNEPKYIKLVVEEIAKLRGVSTEEIINITTENACRLLRINL